MAVEICAVGGYGECGKNMTAVKVDDEVVIFDIGLHLPNWIKFTNQEHEQVVAYNTDELKKVRAIPDDTVIDDWKDNVVAIIPGHAHLDHVGAVPFMADDYNCPIIATPMTAAVVKTICRDEKIKIRNKIIPLASNSKYKISENLTVEFVHITHSIPHSVMVALHTKYGVILYATDFKLDNDPILGKPPNYEKLKELAKKGILVSIIDALYAKEAKKTASERVAREMLRDTMLGVDSKGKAVFVTTFASHIARLKSIIEFGKQMKRKIVFMGRSLTKYAMAAEAAKLVNFRKDVEFCKFGREIKKKLREIEKRGPEKYLMVVTGHQGEPQSTLSKLTTNVLPFRFKSEDHVIFSCTVIPTAINRAHREVLEASLKDKGVRIFKDLHVSGHGCKEDMRDFIKMVTPKHIIPTHAEAESNQAFMELGVELGYQEGKTVHNLLNGHRLRL